MPETWIDHFLVDTDFSSLPYTTAWGLGPDESAHPRRRLPYWEGPEDVEGPEHDIIYCAAHKGVLIEEGSTFRVMIRTKRLIDYGGQAFWVYSGIPGVHLTNPEYTGIIAKISLVRPFIEGSGSDTLQWYLYAQVRHRGELLFQRSAFGFWLAQPAGIDFGIWAERVDGGAPLISFVVSNNPELTYQVTEQQSSIFDAELLQAGFGMLSFYGGGSGTYAACQSFKIQYEPANPIQEEIEEEDEGPDVGDGHGDPGGGTDPGGGGTDTDDGTGGNIGGLDVSRHFYLIRDSVKTIPETAATLRRVKLALRYLDQRLKAKEEEVPSGSEVTFSPTEAYWPSSPSTVADALNALAARVNLLEVLTTEGDIIVHNGTAPARLAIGADGAVLTSTGTTAQWEALPSGISVIDELDDVDTTTGPPALNEVLKWDGSNWVPGTAGVTDEFTFSIDSFSDGISDTGQLIGAGTWQAIGAITFTATYSNAPGGMTAEVAMSGSATAWAGNLSMTPVEGPETNTEAVDYPAATGGTITFTLSQSADASTDQESVSFNNTMRYGNSTLTQGNQTEASLEALTEVAGPSESRSQTISNISTTANYLVFAHADRLSSIQQVRRNSGLGYVTASFHSTRTSVAPSVQTGVASVTNSAGYSESFECITATDTGLANGTNDFQLVASATAQNYLYWGELNVDAGGDGGAVYTEANVEGNYASQPGKTASNSISSRSMTVNCAVDEYVYIAYPSRLGALSSIVIGGFESISDFWIDHGSGTELAVTNDAGFTENYYVYVSKNPGFTDPTTMTVSL